MSDAGAARLQQIFAAVFQLPAATPAKEIEAMEQETNERWDSIAQVTLVAALEEEFGLSLQPEEMLALTSYQAFANMLEQKGV